MLVTQQDSPSESHASEVRADRLLREGADASPTTIMIVDDEPINIKLAEKYLRQGGYDQFISTSESREALAIIRSQRPDVVLLDIMMPHISGLNILEVIRGDLKLHYLPVLMLTAATDEQTKAQALNLGATDLLNKPVRPVELIPRVKNALVVKKHHDQMVEQSSRLEHEVRERTAELDLARQELIHVLACAAEYRDSDTGNHVLRVGRYAGLIAQRLGFVQDRCELIEQAAALHDVGKIGIPDTILLKPGKLDRQEVEVMKRHCEYGLNILLARPTYANSAARHSMGSPIICRSPILRTAASIASSHHEKWDGSGYPLGLSGEEIPIEGRITAVADVFDALNSRRPYKEPLPYDRCFEILEKGRSKHFDPDVLDAFLAQRDDVITIAEQLADG